MELSVRAELLAAQQEGKVVDDGQAVGPQRHLRPLQLPPHLEGGGAETTGTHKSHDLNLNLASLTFRLRLRLCLTCYCDFLLQTTKPDSVLSVLVFDVVFHLFVFFFWSFYCEALWSVLCCLFLSAWSGMFWSSLA